jgi:hypothetical protein
MQDKLKVDFTSRKKELDKLIMEAVNAMNSSESSAESEEEVKPKKRKADSRRSEKAHQMKRRTGRNLKRRRLGQSLNTPASLAHTSSLRTSQVSWELRKCHAMKLSRKFGQS